MTYRLEISKSFENDLDSVILYIAQRLANKIAAKNLLDKTQETIDIINENPLLFPLYPDDKLSKKGYHHAVVNNYEIFYTVDETEKVIIISRFLYSGQNIINII